jgi:hypothetical protein
MGVLDRVRAKQTEQHKVLQGDASQTDSQAQSSLVLADPPHIVRFKGLMVMLRKVIERNNDGSGMARMGFLLTTLADELGEEMRDVPEPMLRGILYQCGEVIAWVGHGDNFRLPENLQEFAQQIQPQEIPDDTDASVELDTATR